MTQKLIKEIESSVVSIITYDRLGKVSGRGSGFFVTESGEVVTSRHVLLGAFRADVKLADSKIHAIKSILAEDVNADLLLFDLQYPPPVVAYLHVSAGEPEKGERILVVGSPLGLEGTVSDGIISAFRGFPELGKRIQITAPISPGSSGSPVVNLMGEVIGVATAQHIEGQNLNFAIPAEEVLRLMQSKSSENPPCHFSESLETAETLYSAGESYYAAKDYEKALDYYQKAIRKNPQFAEAHCRIGEVHFDLEHYEESSEAFRKAIQNKENFHEAYCELGAAYIKLGRYREAAEAYTQSIRIKPDYIYAYRGLGMAYFTMGRVEEAVNVCIKAIQVAPDDFEFHHNLAVAYRELGPSSYRQSAEAYSKAARLKANDAPIQCEIGTACERMGQHQEAMMCFRRAIRIDPNYAEAYHGLGLVHYQLGLEEEALQWHREAIRINPLEVRALREIGALCISLRRYSEAIEAYKRAILVEPGDGKSHQKLGLAYVLTGDKGSALEEFKILERIDECMAGHLFDCINGVPEQPNQ